MKTAYRTGDLVAPTPDPTDRDFGAPMRRAGETWVYFHLAADGLVLYIGKTGCPVYRMRGHRVNSPWFPEIDRVIWYGPMDGANATEVEREFISLVQPPCNIRHTARDPFFVQPHTTRLENARRRTEQLTRDLADATARLHALERAEAAS